MTHGEMYKLKQKYEENHQFRYVLVIHDFYSISTAYIIHKKSYINNNVDIKNKIKGFCVTEPAKSFR